MPQVSLQLYLVGIAGGISSLYSVLIRPVGSLGVATFFMFTLILWIGIFAEAVGK